MTSNLKSGEEARKLYDSPHYSYVFNCDQGLDTDSSGTPLKFVPVCLKLVEKDS